MALIDKRPTRFSDGTSVIDGDTFDQNGRRVRLQRVDTPELFPSDPARRPQALALMARRVLAEELQRPGTTVETKGRGKFGRALGTVSNDRGDVEKNLVARGLAQPKGFGLPIQDFRHARNTAVNTFRNDLDDPVAKEIRSLPRVRPPRRVYRRPQQNFAGDLIDATQAGGLGAAADLVEGVNQVTGVGGDTAEFLRRKRADQVRTMSDRGREDFSNFGIEGSHLADLRFREGSNLRGAILNLASGVGSFVPTLVAGGGVGGLAAKAALRAGLPAAAGTAGGFGLIGGTQVGGGSAAQARDEFLAMPREIQRRAPRFQELVRQTGDEDKAAAALGEEIAEDAFAPGAVTGAISFAALGPTFERVLRGAGGVLRNTVRGAVSEGVEEFVEGGGQALAVNRALQPIDERSITQGALGEALTGSLIGIGAGGVTGAGAGLARRPFSNEGDDNDFTENGRAAVPLDTEGNEVPPAGDGPGIVQPGVLDGSTPSQPRAAAGVTTTQQNRRTNASTTTEVPPVESGGRPEVLPVGQVATASALPETSAQLSGGVLSPRSEDSEPTPLSDARPTGTGSDDQAAGDGGEATPPIQLETLSTPDLNRFRAQALQVVNGRKSGDLQASMEIVRGINQELQRRNSGGASEEGNRSTTSISDSRVSDRGLDRGAVDGVQAVGSRSAGAPGVPSPRGESREVTTNVPTKQTVDRGASRAALDRADDQLQPVEKGNQRVVAQERDTKTVEDREDQVREPQTALGKAFANAGKIKPKPKKSLKKIAVEGAPSANVLLDENVGEVSEASRSKLGLAPDLQSKKATVGFKDKKTGEEIEGELNDKNLPKPSKRFIGKSEKKNPFVNERFDDGKESEAQAKKRILKFSYIGKPDGSSSEFVEGRLKELQRKAGKRAEYKIVSLGKDANGRPRHVIEETITRSEPAGVRPVEEVDFGDIREAVEKAKNPKDESARLELLQPDGDTIRLDATHITRLGARISGKEQDPEQNLSAKTRNDFARGLGLLLEQGYSVPRDDILAPAAVGKPSGANAGRNAQGESNSAQAERKGEKGKTDLLGALPPDLVIQRFSKKKTTLRQVATATSIELGSAKIPRISQDRVVELQRRVEKLSAFRKNPKGLAPKPLTQQEALDLLAAKINEIDRALLEDPVKGASKTQSRQVEEALRKERKQLARDFQLMSEFDPNEVEEKGKNFTSETSIQARKGEFEAIDTETGEITLEPLTGKLPIVNDAGEVAREAPGNKSRLVQETSEPSKAKDRETQIVGPAQKGQESVIPTRLQGAQVRAIGKSVESRPYGQLLADLMGVLGLKNRVNLIDEEGADTLIKELKGELKQARKDLAGLEGSEEASETFKKERGKEHRARIKALESAIAQLEAVKEESPEGQFLSLDTSSEAADRIPVVFLSSKVASGRAKVGHLSHELGHLIQRAFLDQVIEKARAGDSAAKKLAIDVLGGDWNTMSEEERFLTEERFANNVKRWALTDEQARTPLERFFKEIGAVLKKLWAAIRKQFPKESKEAGYDKFETFMDVVVGTLGGVRSKPKTALGREYQQVVQDMVTGPFLPKRSKSVAQNFSPNQLTEEVYQATKSGAKKSFAAGVNKLNMIKAGRAFLAASKGLSGVIKDISPAIQAADGQLRNILSPETGEQSKAALYVADRFRALVGDTGRQDRVTTIKGVDYRHGGATFGERVQRGGAAALRELAKTLNKIPKRPPLIKRLLSPKAREEGIASKNKYDRIVKYLLLQQPADQAPADIREEVTAVRKYLDKMFGLLNKKLGMKVAFRENYYPLVIDKNQWLERKDEAIEVLKRNGYDGESAPIMWQLIHENDSVLFELEPSEADDQIFGPNFNRKKARLWGPEIQADFAKSGFYIDDLGAILSQYTHSGLKRAVFERMFGAPQLSGEKRFDPAGKINRLLIDAVQVGDISKEDANRIRRKILPAYMGILGARMPPRLRAAQSWVLLGLNVALLPLSTLSSFAEIGQIAVRSGGFKDSLRLTREVFKRMREEGGALKFREQMTEYATLMGTIRDDLTEHVLSDSLSNEYLIPSTHRMSESFFRAIQMKRWTDFTRITGLAFAREAVQDYARRARDGDKEAQLQMKELEISPEQVDAWASADMPIKGHQAMNIALNRWVDTAILRPTAQQRPAWGSDHRMALFWHLKDYMWGFYETMAKRVWTQASRKEGLQRALPPIFLAAALMPLAAMGYEARKWLTEGEPARKEGADFWWEVTQRSGILGPYQLLVDADNADQYGKHFLLSLTGPSTDKLVEFLTKDFDQFVLRTTPGFAQSRALRDWAKENFLGN